MCPISFCTSIGNSTDNEFKKMNNIRGVWKTTGVKYILTIKCRYPSDVDTNSFGANFHT